MNNHFFIDLLHGSNSTENNKGKQTDNTGSTTEETEEVENQSVNNGPTFTPSSISIDGMFVKYEVDAARANTPKEYEKRKEVQWLREHYGIDLDYIVDVVLPKIFKKNDKSLPVKFVSFQNKKDALDKIYVAIEVKDAKGITDANLINIDGYYIIGTVSRPVREDDTNEAEKKVFSAKLSQYNLIMSNLTNNINNKTEKGMIVSSVSSHITGYNTGVMFYNPDTYNNLQYLLNQKPGANPQNLGSNTMWWGIVRNGDIKPVLNLLEKENVSGIDTSLLQKFDAPLGTVVLCIENAEGKLVPAIKMQPVYFNDNKVNRESKYYKLFEDTVYSFVRDTVGLAGNFDNLTEDEIKNILQRLTKLKDYLVIPDAYNHGLYFSLTTNEKSKRAKYNGILTIMNNGKVVTKIDFNKTELSVNAITDKIIDGLKVLNPSWSITPDALKDYTQDLLDANLLRTNVNTLYFENTSPYITPLDKDGKEITNFAPVITTGVRGTSTAPQIKGYIFNGVRHTLEDGTWYWDMDGHKVPVESSDAKQQLKDISEITEDHLIDDKNKIYSIRGHMYRRLGISNFSEISERERKKIEAKKEKEKKDKEDAKTREELRKKQSKKEEVSNKVETSSSNEEESKKEDTKPAVEDTKTTNEITTSLPDSTIKKIDAKSNNAEELLDNALNQTEPTQQKDTKEINFDVNNLENNQIFRNFTVALSQVERLESILLETMTAKTGRKYETLAEIVTELLQSEKRRESIIDVMQNPTEEAIEKLINDIEECGL